MPLCAPVAKQEIPTTGPKACRCIRVIDLGSTENAMYNKMSRNVMITFELPTTKMEDGRPFSISEFYTISMNEKANLRKMLESWRGKEFTDEEATKFDLLKLLNKTALMSVIHKEKNGKTYANLGSIMPLPEGMVCPDAINDVYSFNFDEFDETLFNNLSEKMQKMLMQSEEWKKRSSSQPPEQAHSIQNVNPAVATAETLEPVNALSEKDLIAEQNRLMGSPGLTPENEKF